MVAAPAGARVRTRLFVSAADSVVLEAVGVHLGSLAGRDLARRCEQGRLDRVGQVVSRRVRKQALTAEATSRWAGAITRTAEDAWALAERNLMAEARSLHTRCARIRSRVAAPAGRSSGTARGYGSAAERWEKQHPTRGSATESYQLRRAARTSNRWSGGAANKETRRPPGPRAAAPAAQDPAGRTGIPGQPGDPRPFGATRHASTGSRR